MTRAKILTSYTAERPSELSLVKGNVIVVLEKPQADWWKGEYKGVVGYFPSDHVLELVKTASTAAASNVCRLFFNLFFIYLFYCVTRLTCCRDSRQRRSFAKATFSKSLKR